MDTLQASLKTLETDEKLMDELQIMAREALPDFEVYAMLDNNKHFKVIAQRPDTDQKTGRLEEALDPPNLTLRLPGF